MVLALHGQPSETPAFDFVLADRLHKTLAEIRAMPHDEYVGWAAYIAARGMKEGET